MTTDVPVSIDTSGVQPFADAIAEAVASVSGTPIPIEADVSAISPEIVDAVSGTIPDPVLVEANASSIAPEIDAAVAAANPEPVVVEVDAAAATTSISGLGAAAGESAGEARDLEGATSALGVSAGIAEGSVSELLGSVKEMGGTAGEVAAGVGILGAATAGFFEEGLNAVSAGQAFDLVLGDMATKIREIDVNGLHTSMEELGIQFGSTSAEMENANSKLFSFAVSAGATKEKAVEFTQQVETLAARAISLNPQLGTLAEVTESLGPKLARGGRFASEFKLALTPAEIAARALADTGKSLSSELTVQEKAMAGAEIASERYGKTLAGTVAEGAKNAAVQVDSLKAQFKEAIETIGVPLVAPVIELLREAEPDAALIAKDLSLLAGDVIPVLTDALTAVSIPLQLIDLIISGIPAPIIAGAVAFFGLSFALTAVGSSALFAGVAMETVAVAIPLLAIAGAAVVAISGLLADTPPYVDDVTKAIDSGVKAFDDYGTSIHKVIADEIEAAGKSNDFAKRLNDANVSVDQLAGSLIDGSDAFDKYEKQILLAAQAQNASQATLVKLWQELEHLKTSNEDAAKSAIDSAVATGKLSKADADAAVSSAGLVDGKTNYVRALDTVQPKIKAASDAEEEHAKAEQAAADKAKELQKAMDDLGTSVPAVASALSNVLDTTGPTGDAMLGLATSIDATKLSETQLSGVAKALGVDVESLKKFAHDAGAALDDFVSTAESKLPTLSTAIDDALNPDKRAKKPIIIDPKRLQEEIATSLFAIGVFNSQLADLHAQGLDNLAKISSERGPEFTNALTQAIKKSGTGAALDDQFGALNAATAAEGPLLREAGAGIITATGDIAAIASTDFAGKFDLVQPTQAQLDQARAVAELSNVPFATALKAVAGGGAVAYEQAIGAIPTSTTQALGQANVEIDGWAHNLTAAAQSTGGGASGGFASGIAPVLSTAETVFANVGTAITVAKIPLSTTAKLAGEWIGKSFDDGIGQGIDTYVSAITSAAQRAVQEGVDAARKKANAQSPSKVMAELGADMAAGLAIGLLSDGPADAARAVVAGVVDAARSQMGTARVAAASDGVGVMAGASTSPVSASVAAGRPAPLMNIENATFGDTRVLDDLEWHAATTLVDLTKNSGT